MTNDEFSTSRPVGRLFSDFEAQAIVDAAAGRTACTPPAEKSAPAGVPPTVKDGQGEGTFQAVQQFRNDWPLLAHRLDSMRSRALFDEAPAATVPRLDSLDLRYPFTRSSLGSLAQSRGFYTSARWSVFCASGRYALTGSLMHSGRSV